MLRTLLLATGVVLGLASAAPPASPDSAAARPNQVVVYVTGQDLYYDSIVVADPVPGVGPFQLLEMGPNGLETEFGPGDRGYLGGRWKEDFDGDGVFHYFVCPLLGPGRENP